MVEADRLLGTAVFRGDPEVGGTRTTTFCRARRSCRTCGGRSDPCRGAPRGFERWCELPGPTERLEPAFELLVDACQQQRRLARATLRAFVEDEDLTEVRVDAEQESERLVKRARGGSWTGTLANRAPPVPEA